MAIPWSDRKHYTIGIGLMLAIILVLGLRSKQTMNAVLADKIQLTTETVQHTRLITDELKGVSTRDSLVAVAQLDPNLQSPFDIDLKTAPKNVAKAPTKAARFIRPRLAALIFDDVSPTVQIRVGGVRSQWLRPGDRFKGWKVAEIDSRSVKIKKGDREVVLK